MSAANLLRRARDAAFRGASRVIARMDAVDYRWRVLVEWARYRGRGEVHDLPAIFHYWSNKYLRPKLETIGASHPDEFFLRNLERCYDAASGKRRFLSVGAGNCETEVRLASSLVASGRSEFTLECLDINKAMLARGMAQAAAGDVAAQVAPLHTDINRWQPAGTYDGVIANQSLHHMVALERLFDGIAASLSPAGSFIVSDIIGRNGHMRWPEALAIVEQFWNELPASYRVDCLHRTDDVEFVNRDCSIAGFEGIRAQDILPLAVERFQFDAFIGFANVIDPFVDRCFGPHFSVDRDWDRDFIDRVHARDEAEMEAGNITPAHMFAVMCVGREGRNQHVGNITPERSIRRA